MRLLRCIVLAAVSFAARGSEKTETSLHFAFQEHIPSSTHNESESHPGNEDSASQLSSSRSSSSSPAPIVTSTRARSLTSTQSLCRIVSPAHSASGSPSSLPAAIQPATRIQSLTSTSSLSATPNLTSTPNFTTTPMSTSNRTRNVTANSTVYAPFAPKPNARKDANNATRAKSNARARTGVATQSKSNAPARAGEVFFAAKAKTHAPFLAEDWPCVGSEAGVCDSLAGVVPQGSALWSQMKARPDSGTALLDLIKASPRIIWMSTHTGLSRSWKGAVAFLYIALLTDSLFFMDMGNSSQWEWGYEPHAIDWRVTPAVRKMLSGLPTTTLLASYDSHGNELKGYFEGLGSSHSIFRGRRVLRVIGNRVQWPSLFKNPHYDEALAALNVTSLRAFGCAVGFLARVRKDGCGDFERLAVALLRAKDTVSIGVQVGRGGSVWSALPACAC